MTCSVNSYSQSADNLYSCSGKFSGYISGLLSPIVAAASGSYNRCRRTAIFRKLSFYKQPQRHPRQLSEPFRISAVKDSGKFYSAFPQPMILLPRQIQLFFYFQHCAPLSGSEKQAGPEILFLHIIYIPKTSRLIHQPLHLISLQSRHMAQPVQVFFFCDHF